MSAEVLLAIGYAVALLLGAGALEWLSAHTHRRSLRYRTAGFDYDDQHDSWQCPEGQHLWPHEFDHERRLVRYRAKAHICNGCPRKERLHRLRPGREIVRPLDPWPHSEAGRFHRGLSLMLVALAMLVLVVAAVRNHAPAEAALLAPSCAWCAIRLFTLHPAKERVHRLDSGREVIRPLDPWPHSEAGRFHRGISLMLVALAVMVLIVAGVRHNAPAEVALLAAVLVAALVTGRLLLRDFRRHPAGFPEPAPSHGLGVAMSGTTGKPGEAAGPRRTG